MIFAIISYHNILRLIWDLWSLQKKPLSFNNLSALFACIDFHCIAYVVMLLSYIAYDGTDFYCDIGYDKICHLTRHLGMFFRLYYSIGMLILAVYLALDFKKAKQYREELEMIKLF